MEQQPTNKRIIHNPAILFLALALTISCLHLIAERNIRGPIPPNSDSLAYQNQALHELVLFQKGKYTLSVFLYGTSKTNPVPPLNKWSLQAGYMIFGINNLAPYIVSGLWMVLAAWAIFLLIKSIIEDEALALATGLILLGLPTALNYGFTESRNDWPVAALCLMGFYFFISCGFFKNRNSTIWSALFFGLAILTKSSLPGYLLIPGLILGICTTVRFGKMTVTQRINLAIGIAVIIAVSGWFYIAKYRDIFWYYSFWCGTNAANVKIQYQLKSLSDEYLFYFRNLLIQMGPFPLLVCALGYIGIFLELVFRRKLLTPKAVLALSGAGCLAFAPYLILYTRGAYASIADINMIPFQLFLGVVGCYWLFGRMDLRFHLRWIIILLAVWLNFSAFLKHNQINLYKGINPNKTARDMLGLLKKHEYTDTRLWGLYQDIYFNYATVLNELYRDPVLRRQFNASEPEFNKAIAISSPRLSSSERFDFIVSGGANVLFISNRQKGFKWITVNQEWDTLHDLVKNDTRFVPLGVIDAYDDNTKIEIYAKSLLAIEKESDGWLVNGGRLRLFARPGNYKIIITGDPHAEDVKDMRLVKKDGESIDGRVCPGEKRGCFQFDLNVDRLSLVMEVTSSTPTIPAKLEVSSDTRELIFLQPKVSFF